MKTSVLLCVLILACSLYLSAQDADSLNTGIIDGTVTDESGNPVIGAAIIASDEDDSIFGAMTDALGSYSINEIPQGVYTVYTQMVGMSSVYMTDISLGEDESITLDFVLDFVSIWPVYPLKDTLFTDVIIHTDWSSCYDYTQCDSVDRTSYPGELRLAFLGKIIPDTSSFLNLLTIDHDRVPTDYAFDFNGNSIMEWVGVERELDRVMFFRRPRRPLLHSILISWFYIPQEHQEVFYDPEYKMELITDEIASPQTILLRDLNNDGIPEAIVASDEDNAITCFSLVLLPESEDSTSLWDMYVIQDSTFCAKAVEIADLNGDGNLDIVAVGDSIGFWLNMDLTAGGWVRGTIPSAIDQLRRVACTDFDEDGDIDLLVSGRSGLYIFQNNGRTLSEWPEIYADSRGGGYLANESIHLDENGVLVTTFLPVEEIQPWVKHYKYEGRLVSEVILLEDTPEEAEIDWISSTTDILNNPDATSITFRIKCFSFNRNLSDWSEEILSPGDLMPYIEDSTNRIQYEVILRTNDPECSPVLEELRFEYPYHDSVPDRSSGPIIY